MKFGTGILRPRGGLLAPPRETAALPKSEVIRISSVCAPGRTTGCGVGNFKGSGSQL
jgi:hypothetical protein